MKITDALLDQVYKLQQKRANVIAETGDKRYSYGPTSLPLTAIREQNTLYVMPETPLVPGHLIKHVDVRGPLVVTKVDEEAGRLAVTTMHLPDEVSFFTKRLKAENVLGQPVYELTACNWSNVPAKIDGDVVHLPAGYKPDLGDILLTDGRYVEVKHIRDGGATVAAITTPF